VALIDDVRVICRRLASAGWRDLFGVHGLDLEAANLAAELARPLQTIQRDRPEVRDFSVAANRGIEPGRPSGSLLYHLLALPDVRPALDHDAFPSLLDLDTIENYIFATARRKLSDFDTPVIAVFAYQYRAGFRTPHGFHADMAHSRTGIARVGVRPAFYDRQRRSFWVAAGDSDQFSVMPARYGAFIAEAGGPSADDSVLRPRERDRSQRFIFPRHKLFPGTECLEGITIALEFREWHASQKLQRIHTAGGIEAVAGFDINAAPFVRRSDDLVTLQRVGATVLLAPVPGRSLVRLARQRNSVTRRDEIVRFVVPKASRSNRSSTSLQIVATNKGRAASEYVNVPTRVRNSTTPQNLNTLSEAAFTKLLTAGGYEAAHWVDDTCDGAVAVTVDALRGEIPRYDAYSVVSAPDFMPRVDQVDVQRWAESNLRRVGDHFNQGGPAPLSDGRHSGASKIDGQRHRGRMPNPDVRSPVAVAQPAFDRADAANLTITAVVGAAPMETARSVPARQSRPSTFLPDGASDVFAPGWDVSQYGDALGEFYQNYGLGSPFPEDAKLCAALNSYWPAAAPDAGRTFPELGGVTALPLLDDELGFHPDDPRVKRGEIKSVTGWDGEYGPFFRADGVVNFAGIDRSDYTRNAAEGLIRPGLLAEIDTNEILRRMDALRFCIQKVPPASDTVASTDLWLVSARAVTGWAGHAHPLGATLRGSGYEFVFALRVGKSAATRDRRRRTWRVRRVTRCQISTDVLCWQIDGGAVSEARRPAFEGALSDFPAAAAHRTIG